jgi:OmpA-OmpF porin, OOP family
MNTRKAIAAGLLGLGGSFAHAGGPQPQPPESGFYVGAGLGKGTAKDWCSDPALAGGAARCDDKDTAWRLLAGYKITRNFAVEGGYHDLGKVQATVGVAQRDIKTSLWELNGIGALPIGGIVSVYGKLGVFRSEARGGGALTNIEAKKASVTFGGGVQADLLSSFALRGEWQRYPKIGGGGFGASTDINVLSLLGIYRF